MDAGRFDTLTRSLLARLNRRGVLLGMASGLLAMLPLAMDHDAALAKKHHHKKHKHKHKKPGPPAATCSDGIKNGSETDIDCGGPDCPPCANGRTCERNTDCGTARCGDSQGNGDTCQSCTSDGVCGSDDNGGCTCDDGTGACLSDQDPTIVDSCDACPSGTVCLEFFEGLGCVPLCGG
jgi:hypothetical protein